jgi:hypothetical protein
VTPALESSLAWYKLAGQDKELYPMELIPVETPKTEPGVSQVLALDDRSSVG